MRSQVIIIYPNPKSSHIHPKIQHTTPNRPSTTKNRIKITTNTSHQITVCRTLRLAPRFYHRAGLDGRFSVLFGVFARSPPDQTRDNQAFGLFSCL